MARQPSCLVRFQAWPASRRLTSLSRRFRGATLHPPRRFARRT